MNQLKFRLNILIRMILIILMGCGAYYFLMETPFFLVSFWLILFAVLLAISLIRYIERSYRELTNFLLAIKQNDFSTTYRETETHFQSLHEVFNTITQEFKKIRSEKELNFHFLKTVVEHSGVPLLAFRQESQQVELINESLKELLGVHHVTRLDSLKRKFPELVKTIIDMEDGEKALIKVKLDEELIHVSVVARHVLLYENSYMIIALHNIDSELDQKEIESWQKLIRVLTHEIKNSVIPISTLAEVCNQMLIQDSLNDFSSEDEDDLKVSVKTIEKRSKGLVKFVEAYGNLARAPKPQPRTVDLAGLIRQIVDFQMREAEKRNISIDFSGPNLPVQAFIDEEMIEQVLINLIKNAIEAIDRDGSVEVHLRATLQKLVISVKDDGPGMDEDTRENIFVPFFTTKEKGSGIGLSLSRQIIKAHKGSMRVQSEPGKGTRFEIILEKSD